MEECHGIITIQVKSVNGAGGFGGAHPNKPLPAHLFNF